MNLVACDGTWQTAPDGALHCSGTLTQIPHQGITTEDAIQLKDAGLGLLVIVFCILALKKTAQIR